jgi:hypothetical protein
MFFPTLRKFFTTCNSIIIFYFCKVYFGICALFGVKTSKTPFKKKRLFFFLYCIITYIMCPFFQDLFYSCYVNIVCLCKQLVFFSLFDLLFFFYKFLVFIINGVLEKVVIGFSHPIKAFFTELYLFFYWVYTTMYMHIEGLIFFFKKIFIIFYTNIVVFYHYIKTSYIISFFWKSLLFISSIFKKIVLHLQFNNVRCTIKYTSIFIIFFFIFLYIFTEVRKVSIFLHTKMIKNQMYKKYFLYQNLFVKFFKFR